MNDIAKVIINPTTKKKLMLEYGDMIKEKPFVVFIKLERVYIVQFFIAPFKKTERGQWKVESIYYDRDADRFEDSLWPKTFGRIPSNRDIKEIYFCNKVGLTEVLKQMDVQSKWIVYKLMKKGNK